MLLLFGNIAVLLWGKEDCKSHWLTLISGWVSFVATITIGIIAFKQTKDYKEQNDLFIQEQKDLMWRESQYNHVTKYIEQLMTFQREVDKFSLIKNQGFFLESSSNEIEIKRQKVIYLSDFNMFVNNLTVFLGLSGLFYDKIDEVLEICNAHLMFIKDYTRKN